MKSLVCAIISGLIFGVMLNDSGAFASDTPRRHRARTHAPLPPGGVEHNDFLHTTKRSFSGKNVKIEIDYPETGNKELVEAIQTDIKTAISGPGADTDEDIDAILKRADAINENKGKFTDIRIEKDHFGPACVTFRYIIKESDKAIILEPDNTSPLSQSYDYNVTYRLSDGERFDASMLPQIAQIRPLILDAIAKKYGADLVKNLVSPEDIPYGDVSITDGGLTIQYSPSEIAPSRHGQISICLPFESLPWIPSVAKTFLP